MDFYTFIEAWVFAVLAMTLFSILVSKILRVEVREHFLLAALMESYKTGSDRKPNILKGWVLHFAMGLSFLLFYELLWKITGVERNFLYAFLFGSGMGLLGIIGWMAIFKLHPNPPKIHFRIFYIQLFFAHIVFSVVALMTYMIMGNFLSC